MEINDLTPVEEYDGLVYKRDDLFLPFGKIILFCISGSNNHVLKPGFNLYNLS